MSDVPERERPIGYYRQHNGGIEPRWAAHCADCSFRFETSEWQLAADALNEHRAATREFVPVERVEEPGIVWVAHDENYDYSGVRGIYASLYSALAAYARPWLQRGLGDEGCLIAEDGDAVEQTGMSITRTGVEP